MRISRFDYNGIRAGDHLNLYNYMYVYIEASGRNIGCSLGCRRKTLVLVLSMICFFAVIM